MTLHRSMSLLIPILFFSGCSSVRIGPNKFPEYPVEIRLYYDSRCEAEVVVDGSNTLTYLGALGAGGIAMSEDLQSIYDRSVFFNCSPTKLNNSANAPWSRLNIRIFIDRFMEDERLTEYFTQGLLRSEPIVDKGMLALQQQENATKLQVAKTIRASTGHIFLPNDDLPFDYAVHFHGSKANKAFPRLFRTPFHCDAVDVHSKSGTLTVEAAKDYRKDGLYMTIKGHVILGNGTCY